ncbi:DUF6298 domain-containing protein [Hymenobacter norwichensis]|uniref:DUF6298 domain-containing protein n=1 Tax=Hymenobacter norwichensis TaxID=223903 RepID=UPI0003B4BEBB|nr:DUF6298 domain-containing protein [Hymenobacter norwichensis]
MLAPEVFAQKGPGFDSLAARIDFSYVGYQGRNAVPPKVAAVIRVKPSGKDDTQLLQAAIDYVGALPLQKDGFRGAIQLLEGRYLVAGQLNLAKAGVVLRGTSQTKTVVVATGNSRRALLTIRGEEAAALSEARQVRNTVPTGGRVLTLDQTTGLQVGDHILIVRPSTSTWIADLGMNKAEGMFTAVRGLRWPTGSRDLTWRRQITQVDPQTNQFTLDAPLTTALEAQYGGGTVQKANTQNLAQSIGLEGFTIESSFKKANPLDEEHAWIGIQIDHAQDVWVRDITARHFVSSAVRVGAQARRVSILRCRSEQPVSEVGGYRRMSFLVEGQQVVVSNCTAESGLNDFAIGFCAGGPNVFLKCKATNALGASGSFESWASGVLYENVTVDKAGLRLTYDMDRAQAGGWTAANSLIWNCKAKGAEAQGPIRYPNQVVTAPYSLYQTQLESRLGKHRLPAEKTSDLYKPASKALREFTLQNSSAATVSPSVHPLQFVNGRFVIDGQAVWSGTTGDQFWRGQTFPGGELNSGVSLTRYVPGKDGPGLTEILPHLAKTLRQQDNRFYQSLTGLWYDRRRDDHAVLARPDGNVWAPFYEMPWARSGQGKAWDGLSKFDLTTYNPWFFKRVKEFAYLCDENGLVLYYSLYDTHNLLEYVTHWVDYPWRPTNNINQTKLPEPLPAKPWARLHLGNEFYDPSNASLRNLHRAYIFHTLDELGGSQNIIFNLGFQFSGPLAFQRFFLQTIAEWESKNNRNVRVVLNTTKDITDAILADADLAKQVDVIDTRYWQYRPDGLFSNGDALWAPPSGQNSSFREMVSEAFLQASDYPLPTTQELMYRQVREYTNRFRDKAVVSIANDISPIPSLMAGGAQVIMGSAKDRGNGHLTFASFVQQHLASRLMHLKPDNSFLKDSTQTWCLTEPSRSTVLLYSLSGAEITFSQPFSNATYTGTWYDPLTESMLPAAPIRRLQAGYSIKKPTSRNWLLLLSSVPE